MRRSLFSLTVILAALALTAAPSTASPTSVAATNFTFDVSIETPCIAGHGPTNMPLRVIVRSAGGQRLGAHTITADGSGLWATCFGGLIVEPAMTITARHAAHARTVTVPGLTLRMDRPTDVLSGRAPASGSLALTLSRCVFADPCLVKHYVVTPDSHGRYWDDVSAASYPWDLEGGDKAVIGFTSAKGDWFHVDAVTEFMRVRYPNLVTIQIYPPGAGVTVRLLSSTGVVRARESVTSTVSGAYTLRFTTGGHALNFQPGNVIRGNFSSDAKLVWPDVRLAGHPATGHVSGRCVKDVSIQVTVGDSPGVSQEGVAASDGSFDLDFSATGGVHRGNALLLVCRLDTGDRMEYRAKVP